MKKLKKYLGTETYMFPSGGIATPKAVMEQFPAATAFAHVIETDEASEVMFACMNLSALRSQYEIDPALSEEEAIAAIETILNEPAPEPGSDANERIAAALEFQNLLSI